MTTGVKAAAIAAALGAFAGGAIADAALGLEVSGTTAEHVGEVAFRNGLLCRHHPGVELVAGAVG